MREKEWEWTIDEYKKHIKETPMRGNAMHYENKAGDFDVLDFIQAYELNFSKGNVIKYLCRAGKKAGNEEIQDLNKALDYLKREIQRVRDLNNSEVEKIRGN